MQCLSCGSIACLGCEEQKEIEDGMQRARWFETLDEAVEYMGDQYTPAEIYLMWHAGKILNKDL